MPPWPGWRKRNSLFRASGHTHAETAGAEVWRGSIPSVAARHLPHTRTCVQGWRYQTGSHLTLSYILGEIPERGEQIIAMIGKVDASLTFYRVIPTSFTGLGFLAGCPSVPAWPTPEAAMMPNHVAQRRYGRSTRCGATIHAVAMDRRGHDVLWPHHGCFAPTVRADDSCRAGVRAWTRRAGFPKTCPGKRAGGDPASARVVWIRAFAGMTK